MKNDLETIKKYYGEGMMHFCRDNFSTILDKKQGLLYKLLSNNFNKSKFLYDDLIDNELQYDFKNYIYCLFDEKRDEKNIVIKSPEELMSEVGYKLYECKTENEIQQFKKYYAKNEELCTFHGGRLNSCHVFFAVKENVDEIKRKNFDNPRRQDEYGTSVISIQFTKDPSHTLSIKNRYNHTVENPDATFSNNLDNIIEGLTDSFAKIYGMLQTNRNKYFEIPGYVKAKDGKYYKYNYEVDNIYYCPDNIVIENFAVKQLPKERYLVLDYYILDIMDKKFTSISHILDDFSTSINNISKIEVVKKGDNKQIKITHSDSKTTLITINKLSQIIELESTYISEIGTNYMFYNETITNINLTNVYIVGYNFLCNNNKLVEVKIPNLKIAEGGFLKRNQFLTSLDMPNLDCAGPGFLENNIKLKSLNAPKLRRISNDFLKHNLNITSINLPSVITVEDGFLSDNVLIEYVNMPRLEETGSYFLMSNRRIKSLSLPNLKHVKDRFLYYDTGLRKLEMPSLETVGENFIYYNCELKELSLPKLTKCGTNFIYFNSKIESLYLPNLNRVGDYFLCSNILLKTIDLPNLVLAGDYFMYENIMANEINMPLLYKHGEAFIAMNNNKTLLMPNLNDNSKTEEERENEKNYIK